jgi:acetyl-CoA acetyltransferase
VAEKYHVTREEQDQFSVHSQLKAAQAQAEGIFSKGAISSANIPSACA